METDLIIVREYCQKSHVDPSFIVSLEEDGLIDIRVVDGERYLLESQLQDLERLARGFVREYRGYRCHPRVDGTLTRNAA